MIETPLSETVSFITEAYRHDFNHHYLLCVTDSKSIEHLKQDNTYNFKVDDRVEKLTINLQIEYLPYQEGILLRVDSLRDKKLIASYLIEENILYSFIKVPVEEYRILLYGANGD